MTAEDDVARYPIRAVSKLTGIGIDTLRAWERRYAVVTPSRDGRGRMYSAADVERLRLLQQAVEAGHSVGRAAALSNDELRGLARPRTVQEPSAAPAGAALVDTSRFADALARLDGAAVDHEFSRLATVLPPLMLVTSVLLPTLRSVGDDWTRGRGSIAREHLISSTMRSLLGSFLRLYSRSVLPARLLFATPSGDRHEMGILGAALLAASSGFAVTYLGPDLPAAEIVDGVKASGARVVVLGLTLASTGQNAERELRAIRAGLPEAVELWVGGPARTQASGLSDARTITVGDFDEYLLHLGRLAGSR